MDMLRYLVFTLVQAAGSGLRRQAAAAAWGACLAAFLQHTMSSCMTSHPASLIWACLRTACWSDAANAGVPPTNCIRIAAQALTGAFTFTADLARAMSPVPQGLAVDFFTASSYGATTVSTGDVAVNMAAGKIDVAGRHVIVVRCV